MGARRFKCSFCGMVVTEAGGEPDVKKTGKCPESMNLNREHNWMPY